MIGNIRNTTVRRTILILASVPVLLAHTGVGIVWGVKNFIVDFTMAWHGE